MEYEDGGKRGIPNIGLPWTTVVKLIGKHYKLNWTDAKKKWVEMGKPKTFDSRKPIVSQPVSQTKLNIPFYGNFNKNEVKKTKASERGDFSAVSVPFVYCILFQNKDICNIFKPPFTEHGEAIRKEISGKSGVAKSFNNKLYNTLPNQNGLLTQGFFLDFKTSGERLDVMSSEFYSPEEVVDNIEKNIKKKRFTILSFSIRLTNGYFHNNNIIIDNKNETFERFDPHGTTANTHVNRVLKAMAGEIKYFFYQNKGGDLYDMIGNEENFKKFKKTITGFSDVKHLTMEDLKNDGIQTLESFSTFFRGDGCCQLWSAMYTNLRLLNKDMDEKEMMKMFMQEMDYNVETVYKYIMHYYFEMNSQLESILGEKYVTSKNIFQIFEELKNHFDGKPKSKTGEAPKQVPKEAPKQAPKEAPKQAPKEAPKQAPKEAPTQTSLAMLPLKEWKKAVSDGLKFIEDNNPQNLILSKQKEYITMLRDSMKKSKSGSQSMKIDILDSIFEGLASIKENEPDEPNEEEIFDDKPKIVIKNGDKWAYYGKFGVNETFWEKYVSYIRKLFMSPRKKLPDAEWAKIQEARKSFFESQQATDYFPTPKIVVDRVMKYIKDTPYLSRMVTKDPNTHILEPSAGTGSFVKGFIENFGYYVSSITANEYNKKNILGELFDGVRIKTGDFLEMPAREDYDLIIMNPPFNTAEIKDYFILHIAHAINMLARGGVIILLCPEFHDPEKHEYRGYKPGEKKGDSLNKPLKSVDLTMALTDSKKMTKPLIQKIEKLGDGEIYDKKAKKPQIELRDHQIRLLGYTSGEFESVKHNKKKDVYSVSPLGMKIAIYEIVVA